ncbi:MAG: redoxin domain-containing protein, partial [Bdellovibrionota bacterium]
MTASIQRGILALMLVLTFLFHIFSTLSYAIDAGLPTGLALGFQTAPSLITDVAFRDLNGKSHRLSEFSAKSAVVIVVRDPICPVSKKYGSKLGELSRQFEAKNVQFIFVNVAKVERAQLERDRVDNGFSGLYVDDFEKKAFQGALRIHTSAEVFVVDKNRTLLGRMPVDDQFGISRSKSSVGKEFLLETLTRHLSGQTIEPINLLAPGCVVSEVAPLTESEITYHGQVSRILRARCTRCHQEKGISNMTFDTFEEAKSRAPMIKFVIEQNLMPPWFAHDEFGPFNNDPRLTEREKKSILSWVDGGLKEGSKKDALAVAPERSKWRIKPDVVFRFPEPINVPKNPPFPHQSVWIKSDFKEDRWITGYEIHTTAPRQVHHMIVWSTPKKSELDRFGMPK